MRADLRARTQLGVFIAIVVVAGAAVIAESVREFHLASLNPYVVAAALLTIVTGRFAIKVPGRPATVSVSEVFVFAQILLAGPAVPVLTVALDGLWVSGRQQHRRVYRALFNVAEPAVSTWVAAHVFFAIAGVSPGSPVASGAPVIVPATIGMAAAFFALNSGLSAVGVALETGASAVDVWRSHAWYLAVNDYAAASVATLAVTGPSMINFSVVGLTAPVVVLSYVAYREAAVRADETQRHVDDVERLYRASVEMLAIAVDAKDQVTHGHIRRVQRHCTVVAKALGVRDPLELKAIEAGALLHDIGKLAVPDYVLNKPGALTPAEFETMKKHATMGARILTAVEFPYPIVPIVRHHHERWDGGGYPDGLVGAEIPLGARILSVVDCFDAITSDRPYRARMTDAEAVEVLRARSGVFYDPRVLECFVDLIPQLRADDANLRETGDAHASLVEGIARPSAGREDADEFAADRSAAAVRIATIAPECFDRRLRDLPDTEACLFALNAKGDALVPAHVTTRLRTAFAGWRQPVGSGVSGWVAANRSTIRGADAALDLGEMAAPLDIATCTSVPVFAHGDLFGVLTVYTGRNADSERVSHVAGVAAQEIGLGIVRAEGLGTQRSRSATSGLAAVS